MATRRRFLEVLSTAAAAQLAFSAAPLGCGAPVRPADDDDTEGSASGSTSTSGGGSQASSSGGAPTSGGGENNLPDGMAHAVHVDDLKLDGLVGVGELELFIGYDAGGVYAMSSLCTHKSCSMISRGTVFFVHVLCKCHGSEFDFDGNVIIGPATMPLAHYAVAIDDLGNVGVDVSQVVAADLRVPLT